MPLVRQADPTARIDHGPYSTDFTRRKKHSGKLGPELQRMQHKKEKPPAHGMEQGAGLIKLTQGPVKGKPGRRNNQSLVGRTDIVT